MSKTINILGDTPKQQWLNAVAVYDMSLRANVKSVLGDINEFDVGDLADSHAEKLEAALRVLDSYTQEMRRLVEGVFDEG